MGEEVKLTVIMPSLNVSEYIYESVSSVMKQSLKELEILCIDAGSTDGTEHILEELSEKDSRIKIINSSIKSYGYQVNMGFRKAKGKYVAIVETDDNIDSEMYEMLYDLAEREECDYVKADYYSYYTQDNGERVYFKNKNVATDKVYDKVICPLEHISEVYTDWHLWAGIFRKDFLEKNDIWLSETKGAAFQDIGFGFQILMKAKKALYISKPLYRYCIDRDGASANSNKALGFAYTEYLNIWNRHQNLLSDARVEYAYYTRMALEFLYSFHHDFDAENIEEEKYYEWFRNKIIEAKKRDLLDRNLLEGGTGDKLEALLESRECFKERFLVVKENIANKLKLEDKEIIIFGCGKFGYLAYKFFSEKGISIVAYMDNNKALWGKTFNGISVISPSEIQNYKNVFYVVANELYYRDITKQLLDEGIIDENIAIYAG